MQERILHALDLAVLADWDGAKSVLDGVGDPTALRLYDLFTRMQVIQGDERKRQATIRHELGNAVAIAQSNIEAMIDGVLETTPERLESVREAMALCSHLLEDLRRLQQSSKERLAVEMPADFDLCEVVAAQVTLVAEYAKSKMVRCICGPHRHIRYYGDRDRVARVLLNALLGAARYTPPGGTIEITCVDSSDEIGITVHAPSGEGGDHYGLSHVAKLVEAVGGHARILLDHGTSAKLALEIPATRN